MSINELATVVCVYKTGGDFDVQYVEKLHDSCMANGAEQFICFTDDPEVEWVCDTVEFQSDLPGWWAKLEMFRLKSGKYLYFDLDTVIHQSIEPMLIHPHRFTALRDFNKKVNRLASGIIGWTGDHSYLFTEFTADLIPQYTPSMGGKLGDQAYIEDRLRCEVQYFQDLFPGTIASFKWDDDKTKQSSSIICYHGKPRPKDTGWSI